MRIINTSLLLLTFGLTVLLIVPGLIQDGMFMDGQQYACVSKNLSEGYGSFWLPQLNPSWNKADCNYFLEHPPLVYGMQATFFKIFGSSMYVERLYSFLTAIANILFIILIWNTLFDKNSEYRRLKWFPVLLWITVPVCFWSFQNNMHENTLSFFTLASVFFSLKAVYADKSNKSYLFV
ncbi:MAG: glycosyltransferase family 39 protein, partial [Bacteroidota bacterium]